ncbi:MAG: sel1 repeat family protein [Candidatus Sericytochromatia bacterium]|nr:sel1 repeat family protein [Candidatus Sericytochromatia bacterium]
MNSQRLLHGFIREAAAGLTLVLVSAMLFSLRPIAWAGQAFVAFDLSHQAKSLFNASEATQLMLSAARAYRAGQQNTHHESLSRIQSAAAQGQPIAKALMCQRLAEGIWIEADASNIQTECTQAFDSLLPLAGANDAYAQSLLAYLYQQGLGTNQDLEQALFWLGKAFSQGFELASDILLYGRKNLPSLQAEALQGNAMSTDFLIFNYENGALAEKNEVLLQYWLDQLAQKGSLQEQLKLATRYADGLAWPANQDKAWLWLQEAMQAGHAQAFEHAVRFYEEGKLPAETYRALRTWHQSSQAFRGTYNAEALDWLLISATVKHGYQEAFANLLTQLPKDQYRELAFLTIEFGHLDSLKRLLDAERSLLTTAGPAMLMASLENHQNGTAQFLLEVGVKPDTMALREAFRSSDFDMIFTLLAQGAPVHQLDEQGQPPFFAAVGRSDQADLQKHWRALQKYFDLNTQNTQGETLWHKAFQNQAYTLVRKLLPLVNPELRDQSGRNMSDLLKQHWLAYAPRDQHTVFEPVLDAAKMVHMLTVLERLSKERFNLRKNLYAVQTMVSIYHVDHGMYPSDLAALKLAAQQSASPYWQDICNPIREQADCANALQTGPLSPNAAYIGQVIYTPLKNVAGQVLDYELRAVDHQGKWLRAAEQSQDMVLKPF